MKFLRLWLLCCGGVVLVITILMVISRRLPAEFSLLAYSRTVRNGNHIYVAWGDGSHIRRVSNAHQFNHSPLWSYNGQYLAYQSFSPEGDVWITLQHFYEKRPSGRLPELPGKELLKSWSPNQAVVLAMVTAPQVENQVDLMILSLDGSRQFLHQYKIDRTPAAAWSPDGAWVYFEAPNGEGKALYRVRTDGTDLTVLIPEVTFVYALRWSPDGKWMIFMAEIGEANGIYRMRPDGSEFEHIRATGSDRVEDNWLLWSPDGATVLYMTSETSLYTLQLDNGEVQMLANNAADLIGWRGEWLYYLGVNDAVWRVRLKDGTREQLFYLRGASQISWSPPIDLPFHLGWLLLFGFTGISGVIYLRRL